jgi:Transketolase, C-terminal subunit
VTGRVYDQVRQEVAYGKANVKIASSHAGVTLGEDGATHQTMEDLALMRALPDMVVINPCDFNQTKNATIAAAKYEGPVYLRFGRPNVPNFTPENEEFVIGKAQILNEGKDVTIVACGHLVWEALQAAEALEAEGICAEVINMATVKPLDEEASSLPPPRRRPWSWPRSTTWPAVSARPWPARSPAPSPPPSNSSTVRTASARVARLLHCSRRTALMPSTSLRRRRRSSKGNNGWCRAPLQ